ncbi:MAG: hypothetical protein MZU97_20425 [Bacillus subtilis]|nr:hypothetical protein [Bacillus subtilis]
MNLARQTLFDGVVHDTVFRCGEIDARRSDGFDFQGFLLAFEHQPHAMIAKRFMND